jgi:hypothetical protein
VPQELPRLRTTRLSPLLWLVGIFSSALTGSGLTRSPTWVAVILAVLLVASLVQFLVAYNYLLFTGPQALDSEAHKQEMRRLELAYTGDNRGGFKPSTSDDPISSATGGVTPTPSRRR